MSKVTDQNKPVLRFFLDLLRNTLTKPRREPSKWIGNFDTWEQARQYCTGYDSKQILDKCKSGLIKVRNGEAVYERDSVVFERMEYNWPLLACLAKTAIAQGGYLSVLDFGGSLGSTYFQNREFLCDLDTLKWSVVEQEHFVVCGRENFENQNLKFYYKPEDCIAEQKPNVLLLSSVLQYLEDPYSWLERFVGLGIHTIIIDRSAFIPGDKDTLSVQDVPLYNARLAHWFFSEKKFLKVFLNNYEVHVRDFSFIQFNNELSQSLFYVFKLRV